MRVGLIGRGEDRGLGNLTREWARHMVPERTLLVRPDSARDAGLVQHREWFDEDAIRISFGASGLLDLDIVRGFLEGLDVVYSAETFYDWRVCDLARELGVRTVCHAMPEYFKHTPNAHNYFPDDLPPADVWWAPTTWRLEHLPEGTEVVPVPIPTDRWLPRDTAVTTAIPRWLHTIGSRAASDRNGTRIFLAALKHVKRDHEVIIRSQSEPFYANGGYGRNVHLRTSSLDVADYWELYADADALVLPRRYGGLCLPALEGMGAGLALVMPEVSPNCDWPIIPIEAPFLNALTTSAGSIPICAADPKSLARAMDTCAAQPHRLAEAQAASDAFAEEYSWHRRRGPMWEALERAVG